MSGAMRGRTCLVTGATSGIGKALAQELALRGATVVVGARDASRGGAVVAEIKTLSGNDNVDLVVGDLGYEAGVRAFAAEFQARYSKLHVLINNAGGVFPKQRNQDGIVQTFAINHLASFLLTELLLPVIKASAPARIINVNSDAHLWGKIDLADLQSTRGYRMMQAYGNAKLANLICARELGYRLHGTGVTVNSYHPGMVQTNIGQNVLQSTWGKYVSQGVRKLVGLWGRTPKQGAATGVYLATAPELAEVNGLYYVDEKPTRVNPLVDNRLLAQQVWDASAALVHLVRNGEAMRAR